MFAVKTSEKNAEKIKRPTDFIKKELPEFGPLKHYQLLGDVLILSIPKELQSEKERIAKVYAEALSAKSVLLRKGRIKGVFRTPSLELLYGTGTVTTHKENGILFRFDAAKIMFSGGNIDERIRMGKLRCEGEIVVDMFAGIGYFSIPIAVQAGAKKVFALEINPVSFEYLSENKELNSANKLKPILNDCLNFENKAVADRVIMGYFHNTLQFLPKAFEILKDEGIIHFHTLIPKKALISTLTKIKKIGERYEREILLMKANWVKSFSPHIFHSVLDLKITSR